MALMIRDRCPSDGPALETIGLQAYRLDGYPKYLPDDMEKFLVGPEAIRAWVAELDGEVVGHVALHRRSSQEVMAKMEAVTGLTPENLAFVARLVVAPSGRRRGVARALLATATEGAVALGRRPVLDVLEDNRAAIALYERAGWARAGRVEWNLTDGRLLREFVYLSP
jgi:ribosomal protein S18 acetylase RimI-like enzyme